MRISAYTKQIPSKSTIMERELCVTTSGGGGGGGGGGCTWAGGSRSLSQLHLAGCVEFARPMAGGRLQFQGPKQHSRPTWAAVAQDPQPPVQVYFVRVC